jgi:light-regulated signal transduction histidine kinase (bacteriophytochrome)
MGYLEQPEEALVILWHLKMQMTTSVMASVDITRDFPELRYPSGFEVISGLLVIPISPQGSELMVLFRTARLASSDRAGNPLQNSDDEGIEGGSEPRNTVQPWSEKEVKTAVILHLFYKKSLQTYNQGAAL